MADIIQLLPDSIANQIAAGEVIQRPASVIKELMENSIDSGASEVHVIIKNAGKTLVQVIDNGSGMSETDARLSFERHATSKIREASDLFSIRTKGFRGEALASIAAIAQVELITRKEEEDLGSRILIEGSEVKKQEFCQASPGSKISVKNLFFNVPARRKFLKTDSVELKHLTDEFIRIALSHKNIKFTLHHNEREMYHLLPGKLMQRVRSIWGKKFAGNLVPISENTDIVSLSGYVGKPESAKRSRNQQFLFVNNRFIKNHYLNHAIRMAFEDMISSDVHPVFFVFLEIEPDKIDINIHPTKQEIKFEEERLIYNYLRVSVKQALGKYSLTPTLDFDKKNPLDQLSSHRTEKDYQWDGKHHKDPLAPKGGDNWAQLYEGIKNSDLGGDNRDISSEKTLIDFASEINRENYPDEATPLEESSRSLPFQIHGSYILSQIKTGFIIIDQKNAHERILYERYLKMLSEQKSLSQQEMFPQTIELNPEKAKILEELLPSLESFGFSIENFGKNTFIFNGIPATLKENSDLKGLIEQTIDSYSSNIEIKLGINENIARSFAGSASIKRRKTLSVGEMQQLIDELFACDNPYTAPGGRKCFITYDLDDLSKNFSS